jgi:hypothetical protein
MRSNFSPAYIAYIEVRATFLPFVKGDSEGFFGGKRNKIPPAPFNKGGKKEIMSTFAIMTWKINDTFRLHP